MRQYTPLFFFLVPQNTLWPLGAPLFEHSRKSPIFLVLEFGCSSAPRLKKPRSRWSPIRGHTAALETIALHTWPRAASFSLLIRNAKREEVQEEQAGEGQGAQGSLWAWSRQWGLVQPGYPLEGALRRGALGQQPGTPLPNFWPLGLLYGFPSTSTRTFVISCAQGKALRSHCYPCQGL